MRGRVATDKRNNELPMQLSTRQYGTIPHSPFQKSLSNAETRYSNIGRVSLSILHGLEKIQNYCFTYEVNIITDYKPLLAILKRLWQHYLSEINAPYNTYTNITYASYTSPLQRLT